MAGKSPSDIEMAVLDSEHGSFSILNGAIAENRLIVYWFREENIKRLQSKYILDIQGWDSFELSSFLSTDNGKSWAITHERKYKRNPA